MTVTAHGFSGRYNEVSWSSEHGGSVACAGPNADTITMQTVARGHAFAVKLTNIVAEPGPLTVCVYLFAFGPNANVTKGHYLVKSAHVRVS